MLEESPRAGDSSDFHSIHTFRLLFFHLPEHNTNHRHEGQAVLARASRQNAKAIMQKENNTGVLFRELLPNRFLSDVKLKTKKVMY